MKYLIYLFLFSALLNFSYSQPYYVTGSFQGWDPVSILMYDDGTSGDQIAGDGIYSREVSIVNIGNYEWKVTIGNWTQTWPSSNSWFETNSENQLVLFTFNTNDMDDLWLPNQYIVNTNDPILTSLVAVGSFQSELGEPGDWNNASTITVLRDDGLDGDLYADDNIYTLHAVMPAGTWEGKVVKSGTWNGWGTDGRSINAINFNFATTENQHIYLYCDLNTGRILLNFDYPVPVELSGFSATNINNGVLLMWTTSTETNNLGFEVERSVKEFKSWEKLGFVEGVGNSTEINEYTFIDNYNLTGKMKYRLKQIDFDGTYCYSDIVEIIINIPDNFEMTQNYPNPFNPSTKISWRTPLGSHHTLKVYDVLGNEVATLVDEFKDAGRYDYMFDASNLSSGIYFYQLRSGVFLETKKMILIK